MSYMDAVHWWDAAAGAPVESLSAAPFPQFKHKRPGGLVVTHRTPTGFYFLILYVFGGLWSNFSDSLLSLRCPSKPGNTFSCAPNHPRL